MAGVFYFIILLTSILILLLFGELNGHFRILSLNCCFFLIIICFLWIGAQLPQEIFISYGRILTLFYYKIIVYYLYDEGNTGLEAELGLIYLNERKCPRQKPKVGTIRNSMEKHTRDWKCKY